MPSHAIVYYTHFVDDTVEFELNKIKNEIGGDFRFFAMGCCPERTTLDPLKTDEIEVRAYLREDLRNLPYGGQLQDVNWQTMRRNPDLAIMRFFVGNPNFDYYWVIEYDVRFTGNWKTIIDDLMKSDADLLCTHLTSRRSDPNWMHWNAFSSGNEKLDETDMIRAFLPFCRMSQKLMRSIDSRCKNDWAGHPEALWPTIAKSAGLKIEEIGGRSQNVPTDRRGKYYDSFMSQSGVFLSTFGAWPFYSAKSNFQASSPQDVLWHPVKQ